MFCNFVQMTYMISDFLKNSKWFVTYYKWCLCNYEIPHMILAAIGLNFVVDILFAWPL